jgi:predicted Zn-dependent peptidase
MFVFFDTPTQIFSIEAFFPVGSIHDTKKGLAHFVEHLKFNCSEKYTRQQLFNQLGQLGGIYNARTSKDNTSYYIRTTIDKSKSAMRLFNELVFNTKITSKHVEEERQTIIEEYSSRDPEYSLTSLFGSSHPYSHSSVGTAKDIRSITLQDINQFHDRYYNSNCIIVFVCPRKNKSEILRFATKLFPAFTTQPFDYPSTEIISQKLNPSLYIQNTDTLQTEVSLTFPAVPNTSENQNTVLLLEFLAYALADNLNSILYKELRFKRNLTYAISANYLGYYHLGIFNVSFSTTEKDISGVIAIVLRILAELEINDKKLKELHNAFINTKTMQIQSVLSFCELVGEQAFYQPDFKTKEYISKLKRVITPEKVKRVARETFGQGKKYGLSLTCPNSVNPDTLQKKIVSLRK